MERRIREQRSSVNPYEQHWDAIEELQAVSDARAQVRWAKRTCPAMGTSVLEAYEPDGRGGGGRVRAGGRVTDDPALLPKRRAGP